MNICGFFLVLVLVAAFTSLALKPDHGPYEVYALHVMNRCNKTKKPRERVPSVSSSFWIRNTTDKSLVEANITVHKPLKKLWGHVKMYHEENGRMNLFHVIEKLDCNSIVLPTITRIWGFKPWDNYCIVPKGTYLLRGMNCNSSMNLWFNEMLYGNIVLHQEILRGSTSVLCFQTTFNVAPFTAHKVEELKPNKSKKLR